MVSLLSAPLLIDFGRSTVEPGSVEAQLRRTRESECFHDSNDVLMTCGRTTQLDDTRHASPTLHNFMMLKHSGVVGLSCPSLWSDGRPERALSRTRSVLLMCEGHWCCRILVGHFHRFSTMRISMETRGPAHRHIDWRQAAALDEIAIRQRRIRDGLIGRTFAERIVQSDVKL